MEDKKLEARQVAVTKLELEFDKAFTAKKKEMLWNPIRARKEIEHMRKEYLLKPETVAMFSSVGLIQDYTNLLNRVNKVLDGDLT
jgi:hypothetical protein